MKVRTRMLITFLVVGLLGLIYLLHFVEEKLKPVYLDPIEDDLVEISTLLSSWLALASVDGTLEIEGFEAALKHAMARNLDARIYERTKTGMDLHVYITDHQGRVLFDSDDGRAEGASFARWNDVALTLEGEYGARASWDREGEEPKLFFYVSSPIMVNGRLIGVVGAGKPTPEAWSVYEKMRGEAFFGVYMGVLLAMILAVLFTIWVTKPIRLLTEYAGAIRDGRRTPPPNLGKSDIGLLGRSFEEMRDALEGKKYVEQYVQTLTHEIKSPLSAIKGAAELLDESMPEERRARFLANIRTETSRIQRIVDRLLELSAIESRKVLHNAKEISLPEVLEEILSSMEPLIEAKSIHVLFECTRDTRVHGERFLIHQALSNLTQNAIDFTPVDGEIRITIDEAAVHILDSGPGVPDYAITRVFDRFYSLRRPDTGKKSSGLGMSIVKRVAELHHGEVSLRNVPGTGAEAVFRFPQPSA